jgi:hypothetical protein
MIDNDSELKIQYGYLVYPFNGQTKDIFFVEKTVSRYMVSKNDINTSLQNIPKEFRIFLEEKGYKLTLIKKTYLCSINELCGNIINIKKLIDNETGDINAILLRVSGIGDSDLEQKMQVVKEFIKSKFDIDSDMSNKFMFSKTNRC